jgi:copper chaperone NosL
MVVTARQYLLAGVLFAIASLVAGLVHCAQAAQPAAVVSALAEPAVLQGPAAEAARYAARAVPADARCPVCGMYPARFPTWAAQLALRDGSVRFFDSPREFFVFLDRIARGAAPVAAADVAVAWVTDYGTGGWVQAGAAWYVQGSRVRGPMRSDALPAFAGKDAAAAFIASQGGQLLDFRAAAASVVAAAASGQGQHHHH